MNKIENQTVYICEYCSKRYLSRSGAKKHEELYCENSKSPAQIHIKEKQRVCKHENIETVWRYIAGEAVKEPDYDMCGDCGLVF
jgi:hypothetical protein